MRTSLSSSSTKESIESMPAEIVLPNTYEAPTIATYSEAELIAALGPAHAGSLQENWLELPPPP